MLLPPDTVEWEETASQRTENCGRAPSEPSDHPAHVDTRVR